MLIVFRPDLASAHANLADADPAPNSVLESPPSRITIWFTEPLEPSFSTIEVLDSQGTRVDNDDSAVDPRDPTVMYVTVPDDLPNGTYTVAWRNLSTVDGHTIRGTFFYSVGEPLSAQASDLPSEPALQSPAEPFMRWAVLLGGLTVLGVLMLWLVVLRPPLVSMSDTDDLVARVRDRTDKTVMVGVVVALMGSLGHLLVQASSVHEVSLFETLGEPIRFVITQTEWGRGWLQRTSLLIGALRPDTGHLLRLRHRPSHRRDTALWISTFLVTALAMATLSATSHGAATPGIELAATVTDYIHLLAAAFWVGGLFGLALVLPVIFSESPAGNARQNHPGRPSTVFTRGRAECWRAHRHWPLQRVGARHRHPRARRPVWAGARSEDRAGRCALGLRCDEPAMADPAIRANRKAASLLRRTVTAEAVVGVLVILAAAYLTSLEPARQVASRQGIGVPQSLSFEDTAEGATIDVDIEPGQVGPNTVTVTLTDRLGTRITNASGVDVRLTYLDADLGEGLLSTEEVEKASILPPKSRSTSPALTRWRWPSVGPTPSTLEPRSASRSPLAEASAVPPSTRRRTPVDFSSE